jgi:ADP-ribose pyrophosphatase YjhB (NUDIX family)
VARYCFNCGTELPAEPPITCPGCGQAHHLNPKPCAEAVVIRGSEVLLMRRARDPWQGAWEAPGGFCEPGEHPAAAAERELQEELGLAGRVIAYIGSWIDIYEAPGTGQAGEHTLNCAYLTELIDPGAQPALQPDEVLEVGWFALGSLPEELAFPDHMGAMLAAAARLDRDHLPPLLDIG